MAHTKGPWKANKYKGLGNRDVFIVQQEGGDFFSIADVFTHNDKANAHLIAAAPDLLAACEQVAAWIEIHPDFQNWPASKSYLSQLQQAITKAKGES